MKKEQREERRYETQDEWILNFVEENVGNASRNKKEKWRRA